jgi:2-keto-4-pentenoate hydratase/2-oxohepta-3-ene-1,7-dioic acid hydratase in catechol pathway
MDKIICVGKNYLKHAKELGDALNEEPILFIKPPSTMLIADVAPTPLILPQHHEAHHEVELVFRIAKKNEGFTFSHFTFGLDLTLRDLQSSLKKLGQPWEKAKVFKNSSVVGAWQVMTSLEEVMKTPFEVSVNGAIRQQGLGNDMRWNGFLSATETSCSQAHPKEWGLCVLAMSWLSLAARSATASNVWLLPHPLLNSD